MRAVTELGVLSYPVFQSAPRWAPGLRASHTTNHTLLHTIGGQRCRRRGVLSWRRSPGRGCGRSVSPRWGDRMQTGTPLPFAVLLRRHRRAVGLTQEALAERAGL